MYLNVSWLVWLSDVKEVGLYSAFIVVPHTQLLLLLLLKK